jgi:hypothetical protein
MTSELLRNISVRSGWLPTEKQMRVTEALPSSTSALALLQRRLAFDAVKKGVPQMDAEDVAARALNKALLEKPRQGSPPLPVRVRGALRDEIADYYRRRAARPHIDRHNEIPEEAEELDLDAGRRFRQLAVALRERLGDDVLEYAFLVVSGHSERDISERPGWDQLRAGRVRKRLERNGPKLLDALDHHRQQRKEAS